MATLGRVAFFCYTRFASRTLSTSAGKVIGFHAGGDAMAKCFKWYPSYIISDKFTIGNGHVCMVLNREITIPTTVAQNLWENAQLRCTVDGGTNHWRQFLENKCQGKTMKLPDVISGDFDSLTKETADFFDVVPKVLTPDQNNTDFFKAIAVVKPLMEAMKLNDIIVFHDTSGRLDQLLANINVLFKVQTDLLNVYLLSGNSLTWLLRPGRHSIHIPNELIDNKMWCALMPIGQQAQSVTTKGLKWDLSNSEMEFGALVSTSNTYADDVVNIETKNCLVWSMGIFSNCEST